MKTLAVRVIPCLDVRAGRVVKGVSFRALTDQGDPGELAAAYEAQGADELVVLDVTATAEGRSTQAETIRAVRRHLSVPLTAGGGITEIADGTALLEAGADKVSINTAAFLRPALLSDLAQSFGRQCIVVAIDAARTVSTARCESGYEVVIRSGSERTGVDVVEWAVTAVELGAGEILLTSFDRDGTRIGYDLDLLRRIRGSVDVPIVASGGADSPEHMAQAANAGADAVLAASIFHQEQWTVKAVKEALTELGVKVRPTFQVSAQPPAEKTCTPNSRLAR